MLRFQIEDVLYCNICIYQWTFQYYFLLYLNSSFFFN
jgi:hypothetical protein